MSACEYDFPLRLGHCLPRFDPQCASLHDSQKVSLKELYQKIKSPPLLHIRAWRPRGQGHEKDRMNSRGFERFPFQATILAPSEIQEALGISSAGVLA